MTTKSQDDLQADYNQIYARPEGAMRPSEVETSLNGPWHSMLRKQLEDIRGLKVLEVACGQGALCYWLNQQQQDTQNNTQQGEVWSGDFSGEAVAQCKDLVGQGFPETVNRIQQLDLQSLPFEDNTFDVMVSCETLEHIPDPDKGLAEMFRVLKPGGRLYLTTENYLNFTGLYRLLEEKVRNRPWKSGAFVQPIEHNFIAPSFLEQMKSHGFTINRFDSRGHYLYFPKQPYPTDMTWLTLPGPHRLLLKYTGRHLFVKATKS